MAAPPLPNLLHGIHFAGLVAIALCRHTNHVANCSGSRMLLSLCGIAPSRWLREVMRFKALRLSLASNEVRQTTHANAD